ncbi:hypothetical protein K431DRAFT_289717 [Polychaeton citri CBS 116435]|uniref:Uncharacterized protein n=1 Tax=Polychaeton citri CBS 116435 TaxID=1314669 RepID=A0A9P4PW65_9PEZI|nr:hypothetical protein K431DRAFT_289717 [Polychaeton citri CBS 116435]
MSGLAPNHPPESEGNREYEASSEAAEEIQKALRQDGHRVWGFVIYRCTYASDPAWESCLARIKASVQDWLEDDLVLLEDDRFKLTIMDDASLFDKASPEIIRQHFLTWRETAVHEDQGSAQEIASRLRNPTRASRPGYDWKGRSARYRYFVAIDEESLQSILKSKESWAENNGEPDEAKGWVKLVRANFRRLPTDDEGYFENEDYQGEEDHEDEDAEDDGDDWSPIDEYTRKDVGWMKAMHDNLMPGFYNGLRDGENWTSFYERPPGVAEGPL